MADNPFAKYRSAQPVLASPTDPLVAAEEARRQQDQEFEAERLRIAQQQAAIAAQQAQVDAARAPSQIELSQAQAAQAGANVEQAQRDLAKEDEANSRKLVQRALQTDSVIEAINIARRQIGEGWATGNFFGGDFWQGVPGAGQASANLDATLSGLQGSIINDTLAQLKELSASGASGYGALTETEAARLAASVAALQQTQDADALRTGLARVERHYRNALALLNNEDPRIPEVAEKYGIVLEGSDGGGEDDGPPTGGGLTSAGRWGDNDPALKGVNASVRDMIRRGRTVEEIRDYMNAVQPGLGDRVQQLDRAVEAVRQNPDQDINIDLERQWIPNSGAMQAVGDFGMSPVGSALIGAADTASLGFLDNLTSNPDMARAVMSGVSDENPTSYLLGQIVGGAGTGIGLEAAIARGGLTGLRGARAGDAIFGAGYGAGMADDPDDSRISGALLGAGAGVVGGAAGRGAARAVGRGLSGVQGAAQRALDRAGVRMTPGQILGGGVKRTEDRLAGLPVVGDAIQARRAEGIEDFNRAAFNQASDALGAPVPDNIGAAGIDSLRAARTQRYSDLLDGQNFSIDPQFENDIAALLLRSADLPEDLSGTVAASLERRIGDAVQDAGGMDVISGPSYQRALKGLDSDVRSLMRQAPVMGDMAEDVVRGGRQALLDVVERQQPGVSAELSQINRGNMLMETARRAVDTARNQGEVFTPAQLSSAATIQARRFGNNQGTTQQPFYELARAGQEVLPSQIPDSGTAGRLVLPLLAGSVAGGGGYVTSEGEAVERAGSGATAAIVAALLASAPYSPTARNSLQRIMMADRPRIVEQAGQGLIDRAGIAGLLATPATVGYIAE